MEEIVAELMAKSYVQEVTYDKPLVDLLNDNIRKISIWVLIASALFTFIAVLLINSSIRLSIYSKRFIIKTMQMVGATKTFIRRPFIWTNVKLGMIGAAVAIVALIAALFYAENTFPEMAILDDFVILGILFVTVFLLGILIAFLSTYFAAQRFLNLRTDELYY